MIDHVSSESTRLSLKSSEIKFIIDYQASFCQILDMILTPKKKLSFVDLVKIVHDQFNKNAAKKTHLYKVYSFIYCFFCKCFYL